MARQTAQWEQPPNLPGTHFVDNRVYTSREIFEEERQKIFRKVWQLACHESEVPAQYDFRALDVVGTPLIVTRGEDGKIRTFLNACSHRGAKVVSSLRGNSRGFTCPFHLWAYDNYGNCTGITRSEASEAAGCRKEDLGLRQVRTEVVKGLVFVCLDDDAEPLDTFLGPALGPVDALLTTEPMEVFFYNEMIISANWKNWQEVNSELYHEYLHAINRRTSMTQSGYFDRFWTFHPNGHGSVQGGLIVDYSKYKGWTRERAGKPLPGLKRNEYMAVDIWPNVAFVIRDSGLRIDIVTPLAPDRALIQFRALAPMSDTAEERALRVRDHNQLWGPFGRNIPEDIRATELQREAMASASVPYSLIAREEGGRSQDEITLRNYYKEWSRRMGRAASNIDLPA